MAQNPPDPDQPIAWRAIRPDTPVRSSEGESVGTVADVVGSDAEDTFHGVVVAISGRDGHEVLVLADDVETIALGHIDVVWPSAVLRSMPPFHAESDFHLGVKGRFRKGPGWVEDKDR